MSVGTKSPALHYSDDTEFKKEDSMSALNRKKYNVIAEQTRKEIIRLLTEQRVPIKEVAQKYKLKLSTCKAILQVYLKEGRIGKKATRDRKSKIVNTVIIATINPLNPLQATVSPFVTVYETKNPSSKEENRGELIAEALYRAHENFRQLLNHQQGAFGSISAPSAATATCDSEDVPESYRNSLQQTLIQSQFSALQQMMRVRKPSQDVQLSTRSGDDSVLPLTPALLAVSTPSLPPHFDGLETITKKRITEKSFIRKNSVIISPNDSRRDEEYAARRMEAAATTATALPSQGDEPNDNFHI